MVFILRMTYGVVAVGHTAAASATTSLAHAYSEKLERKERKKKKKKKKLRISHLLDWSNDNARERVDILVGRERGCVL